MKLNDNPSLISLIEKGDFVRDYDFDDAPLELRESIVDYLNEKLPTEWPHDPFNGKVSIDGFHDAGIVEYNDHIEFQVDSDRYRICIVVVISGNEAALGEL